jgi:hypothetical protein
LEDELEPKLHEIERLAQRWYEDFLRANKFHLENGTVVADDGQFAESTWGAPPPSREDRERPMRENWRIFNDNLAVLRSRFRGFYELDPLDYTILVGKMGGTGRVAPPEGPPTSVFDRIGYADQTWMDPVDGMINQKQWSGPAATTFHEQFLVKFDSAAAQQQAYARLLGVTAQAYHEGVVKAHEALLRIADTCIARLIEDYGTPGLADTMETLSITSIIAGALAFFPALAVPAGTVSLSTSVLGYAAAKAPTGDPYEAAEVEGYAAPEIIVSTYDAVIAVEASLARLDEALTNCMNWDLVDPASFASPGLRLSRPTLADNQDNMGQLTIQSVPGIPLTQDAVVVSIVDLYTAGFVNMAGAAGQYAEAEAKLATCALPGASNRYFPRAVITFTEARDVLAGILRDTREIIVAVGSALVECANGYELTDAQEAEYLRQVGQVYVPIPEEPGGNRVGGV